MSLSAALIKQQNGNQNTSISLIPSPKFEIFGQWLIILGLTENFHAESYNAHDMDG